MKILGIDPGYERLGVAVTEGPRGKETLLYSNCLRTKATLTFPERLLILGKEVELLLENYAPDYCALENLFITTNQKTAMRVAEVRGMLIYLAQKYGVPIVEYTPLQIKDAIVGFGRGEKSQVMAMIPKLISVPAGKRLDDEYDAIAVALTASASLRE